MHLKDGNFNAMARPASNPMKRRCPIKLVALMVVLDRKTVFGSAISAAHGYDHAGEARSFTRAPR
ncbi:hypothetical protein [Noviherbaspirillum cavernae]|uniref:hypothetical protein n=1 Tax=Noviherbaspirillum cavernae TaxID=2320862 RepID=UPI001314F8DB|nr:hypothetical protein [Noviherbaspirillum cavernae]